MRQRETYQQMAESAEKVEQELRELKGRVEQLVLSFHALLKFLDLSIDIRREREGGPKRCQVDVADDEPTQEQDPRSSLELRVAEVEAEVLTWKTGLFAHKQAINRLEEQVDQLMDHISLTKQEARTLGVEEES